MLKDRRCLLVIDDLPNTIPIDDAVRALKERCGPGSAVLITSQLAYRGIENVDIPDMDREEARRVLEHATATPCPDPLFDSIMSAVVGHPLALAMLNGSAREGSSWAEVAEDALNVGKLPVPQRGAMLATLVLQRWRPLIEDALAFFLWVGSPHVHEGLCRHSIRASGVITVRRLGLLAGGQPGTLRLHDIAWAAARSLTPPIVIDQPALGTAVDRFVRDVSAEDAGTLSLNQLVRIHQEVLNRLVQSADKTYGHLYAWLHYPGPGEVTVTSLPNPVEFAAEVVHGNDDFAIQTAAELAESVLRLSLKSRSDSSRIYTEEELLQPFEILLQAPNVSAPAKQHVRHHFAKALKRLKRWDDAIRVCQDLINEAPTLASTRLLLARTLTELPKPLRTVARGDQAKAILIELLDEALADPDRASISVTLAAMELLRRNAIQVEFAAFFQKYGGLLESQILDAAHRGLEQATFAFGALGGEWSRLDPDGFNRVFEQIQVPSPEGTAEWDESIAWGEVLKAAAKTAQSPERERLLEEAAKFFSRPTTRYAATHLADTLTQLGKPQESLSVLTELVARDSKARDDMWVLQRFSEAHAANGNEAKALEYALLSCEKLDERNRHTPYILEWCAQRLAVAGHHDEAEAHLVRAKEWNTPRSAAHE
jgi:tetratricopeptide (TPR) repeat protein